MQIDQELLEVLPQFMEQASSSRVPDKTRAHFIDERSGK